MQGKKTTLRLRRCPATNSAIQAIFHNDGAGRENRTLMTLRSADFESAASTSSTIPARVNWSKFYNAPAMRVADFNYELPAELIAQHPAPERSASRLLRLNAASGAIEDLRFADLPMLLGPGDAVVVNDTRVIKARLTGRKRSGGKIELFVERALG